MRKAFILVGGVLTGLLLVLLVAAWWLGGFRDVELTREQRGPYRIVCLPHTGAYTDTPRKVLEVKRRLKALGDQLDVACGIYYDDPGKVPKGKLQSKGGYVLIGEVTVEAPLEIERVARREVLLARFKGHPSIGRVKAYPKMAEWMKTNGAERAGPALELYHEGLFECEIPIRIAGE